MPFFNYWTCTIPQIVQSSLIAITDQVATILVTFEEAPDSEVLLLKPRLKQLDQLYFAEKKSMSAKFKGLLDTMTGALLSFISLRTELHFIPPLAELHSSPPHHSWHAI